jgi:hypothetical protein
MKNLILSLILVTIVSCDKNNQTFKGDLYFKLVNLIPQEGFSNERVNEIERMLDSIQNQKNDNKSIISDFEKLRKYKLLKSPNIQLRFSDGKIKRVFLNNNEYQKIKKYTLDYLNKNHTKLEVELKIQELEKDMFFSEMIVNFNEVKGITYSHK